MKGLRKEMVISSKVPSAIIVAALVGVTTHDLGKLKFQGLGASEIARQLRIGRASVYRVLEDKTLP